MVTIAVKKVDDKIYRKVKALASLKGRTVGEAVNEALAMWLSQRTDLALMDKWDELDKQARINNLEYERLRPELLARSKGEFVVISSGRLVGVYHRSEDAYEEASKSGGAQSIVAEVSDEKPRSVELGFSFLEETS